MSYTPKIVILGAGYAGITLATRLDKTGSSTKIILVDANEYHDLIQQAHLVAGGIKRKEEARYKILDIIENSNIHFIKSFVKKIKANEKKVILEDKEIEFDFLVVALGATTQSFGIENIQKHCLTLHSIDDALEIRNKVQNLIYKNNNKNNKKETFAKIKGEDKDEKDHIVIVGGGPTGTGITGTISEFVNKSRGQLSKSIKITLVTASPTILQNWNKRMIDEATKILQGKGINILTNNFVKDVTKDEIILDNGQKINSSLVIWTPGVKGFELPFEPDVEKTKDQRIVINEYCQINKFPDIFCIGDIAAIKDFAGEDGEIKHPPLGQIAISQAIYLAETIPEFFIKDKKPPKKFDYDIKISILPMGEDDYIGIIDGKFVKGKIAKILKEFRYKAYKEEISSDKTNRVNDLLYKDDPLSNLL
jgi:NADH:ubiquinone reductase (H+-translocating)